MDGMRVIIAAGGTGGHIVPALALGEEIRNRFPQADVLFVGTNRGLEQRLIPAAGFRLKTIVSSGWIRGFAPTDLFRNVLMPFKMFFGIVQSWMVLKQFRPQVVIGCGGYVTGPVVLLAALSGRAILLQEQNSRPGRTTLWLSRFARRVHVAYEDALPFFPRTGQVRVSGNPLRRGLARRDRQTAAAFFGLDPARRTLVVVGGSLGSHAINMALMNVVEALLERTPVQVLWQTGKADAEVVLQKMAAHHGRVVVAPFIDAMAQAYACADLLLCRAGAMTIAEMTLMGLPAVLVPYPYAADHHQEHNAMSLVRRGAAVMIRDTELPEKLERELMRLLSDENTLNDMAARSLALARPDAARYIIDDMIELISK